MTLANCVTARGPRDAENLNEGDLNVLRATLSAAFVAVLALSLTGCMSIYYNFWSTFGKEKRDLLKDNVAALREDQEGVSDQFKDALTRLQELYGTSGSKLESTYKDLRADYDKAEKDADALRDRIKKVERIADDLFAEWDGEIKEIHNPVYRADSRRKLDETRRKFAKLRQSMHRAEAGLTPVLTTFNDQVLYLKHNLNAEALGTLKGEAHAIEAGIAHLIGAMRQSIAASNEFLGTLDASTAVAH